MNQRHFTAIHMFQLVVCASGLLALLAGCPVSDPTLPGINQDPTADAGADITIDVGQRVTLNALGSTDADDDALTFSWQQRSGPTVTLDGANTPQPSFVPVEDGLYEFALTVSDGRGGSDVSVVRVFVVNVDPATRPPADDATPPRAFPNAVEWTISDGGNGHLYEAVLANGDITWEEAQEVAVARGHGWHLATITSEAENGFVKSLFGNNPEFFNCCANSSLVGRVASGPWLGATSSTNATNDWHWVTEDFFGFSDWGPFEPFGNGNHISYAEFGVSRQIAWNDIPSGHGLGPQSYILERSDDSDVCTKEKCDEERPPPANVLFEDDFEADDCLGQWVVGGRQLEGVNIANCEERGESTRGHLFKFSFTEITLTPDREPFTFSNDLKFEFDMEVRVSSTGGAPGAFYGQSGVGFAFYNAEGDRIGHVSYTAATTKFPFDFAGSDATVAVIPIAANVNRAYSLTAEEILAHIAVDDDVASVGMTFRTYSSTRPIPSVEAELWIDNVRVTSGSD